MKTEDASSMLCAAGGKLEGNLRQTVELNQASSLLKN